MLINGATIIRVRRSNTTNSSSSTSSSKAMTWFTLKGRRLRPSLACKNQRSISLSILDDGERRQRTKRVAPRISISGVGVPNWRRDSVALSRPGSTSEIRPT
jgi:hypothetical protein